MQIVLVTGFLNSHLISLTEEFNSKYHFHLIVTQEFKVSKDDYAKQTIERSYVHHYYKEEEKEFCKKIIKECDIAIFGGNSGELMDERMQLNKLSFCYSERFFKKGTWRRFIPMVRKKLAFVVKNRDKNLYFLAANGYLPLDLSLLKFKKEKCFQWGYFPETKQLDIEKLQKKENSIVWCARLIDLKRGDLAIKAAKLLKKKGYNFQLTMVGEGNARDKWQKQIDESKLTECVHLVGAKKPNEVREIMEESKIFIFTSNRLEGWGVVLNEAMNSACAPISSHLTGSAPFLIKQKVNGLLFKDGSAKSLYKQLAYLLDNPEKTDEMGRAAYKEICFEYSAKQAVERLVNLAEALSKGENSPYTEGLCSQAKIIKE